MAGKKNSKKKKGKKGCKKKLKRDVTAAVRIESWDEFRKRPFWLEKDAWIGKLKPPQGEGHIDRLYFSNCTQSATVVDLQVELYPAAGGGSTPMSFPVPIAPMTNGLLMGPPPDFETINVGLSAMVEIGGTFHQYDYQCDIPAINGEFINCIVIGIAEYARGSNLNLDPFGLMYGSQGSIYCVDPAKMTVTPLP